MKNYFTIFIGLILTGCYTSNQMIISGNRSGGRSSQTPFNNSRVVSQPTAYSAKPKPYQQLNNKSSNINNQTTTIYFTNNTVNTNNITSTNHSVTNGVTNTNKTPYVSDVLIEESVLAGRYYIIQ